MLRKGSQYTARSTFPFASTCRSLAFIGRWGACTEEGVYPIRVSHAKWFLDAGRPRPVLGIMRHQVPLSPAFALAVHSVQGKEEDPFNR